ncbi:unnamed protein product [Notodromas monacha]|uniref:Cytidine deaminase n=1 Tax=Notodromas monacha TaxID=399045 RepID=A0A7R9GKX9_9CRUS|nr:unnamed protein product [Notodromas monacha]CAG0925107.1 unnamed protein product [Notodromas monacha]
MVHGNPEDEFTDELIKKLATAASEARLNAYAPYSKFQVGAALLCDNEEIVKGFFGSILVLSATLLFRATPFT